MATRKKGPSRPAGVERTIKTTIQLTPQVYERLGALVAKKRAAGEQIDRSKLAVSILEVELRRVVIAIRSGQDPEDAVTLAAG